MEMASGAVRGVVESRMRAAPATQIQGERGDLFIAQRPGIRRAEQLPEDALARLNADLARLIQHTNLADQSAANEPMSNPVR